MLHRLALLMPQRVSGGRRLVRALGALAVMVAWLAPSEARADVSSWASVSAGPSFIDEGKGEGLVSQAALTLQAGLGSPPSDLVIVGGLFQLETHFGRGTDLGLLARVATQGFVLGDWGAALDLGGYERFWGVGSAGGLGALVLGAPWGLTLRAEGGIGSHDARHFGVMLGIDFLRLSVYRTSGENWFPNPYPAYRPER